MGLLKYVAALLFFFSFTFLTPCDLTPLKYLIRVSVVKFKLRIRRESSVFQICSYIVVINSSDSATLSHSLALHMSKKCDVMIYDSFVECDSV